MRDRDRRWQTEPLQCWGKFKELRQRLYQEISTAKEQGKILVTGSTGTPIPVLDGLGDDIVYLGGEGYGGSAATDPKVHLEYTAAVEARGYSRELCSYMRNYWGSMFSNHFMFTGGPFPKPDFCFTKHACDTGQGKWFQVVAEHFGIPHLVVDTPRSGLDPSGLDAKIDYVAQQIGDRIDEMEKITGRKFDDERFFAASRSHFQSESLWTEVCLLNSAIPAPLDLKTILALMPVAILLRNKPDGAEAIRLLRDEVKDRIARQIASTEFERIRLVTDQVPPWTAIHIFRHFQDRGVVFVGLWNYVVNGGAAEFHADGSVTPARTPDELGVPMHTREDLLRVWGRWMVDHPSQRGMADPADNAKQLISLFRHYCGDGFVLHYNRGCKPCINFHPEVKTLLEREGIPVAVYEANVGDVRDTDVAQILKRWGAFVDILEPMVAMR